MRTYYEGRFGHGVPGRLAGWNDFEKRAIATVASAEDARTGALMPVNRFFNRVPGVGDQEHWQSEDYWATPAETIASNGADCEDFAIAKYYTLKELGVPASQLRLVYVRHALVHEAHMVLAWYSAPGADPLILDNLEDSIRPASQRPELQAVYSFNDEDLEVLRANAPSVRVSPASNRKWAIVLDKLQRELAF